MSIVATYTVAGMTCAHCVGAVTEELNRLDGVREISIDLVVGGTSVVRVTSADALDAAAVRDAVDEAGYELVATDVAAGPDRVNGTE